MVEWGALGELVGGIAIIVSLVYVGIQVKQNTKVLRLNTAHNTTEDLADLYLIPAQNSEIANIFFQGIQDIDALQGVERLRFYGYLHKFIRTYENAHYQFSSGALESGSFNGITEQFIFVTSLPGGQAYWEERKSWYNENFRSFVDRKLASPDRETYRLPGT